MDILKVLRRESEASLKVYLYEENGHWFAYENSAYLLNQLLEGAVSVKQLICDSFLMINRAEVNLELLGSCSIISCSDTELQIAC